MKMFKVTYKFKDRFSWKVGFKLLQANSIEDANRKADIWQKLIIKTDIL
jgi:hypothetical protein